MFCSFIRLKMRKEPASAALLHDFSTMVTRQLAESIIAVDNRPIHNLGITQNKICVCQDIMRNLLDTRYSDWSKGKGTVYRSRNY